MKLYEEDYIDEKIIRVIQTYIEKRFSLSKLKSIFPNRYLPDFRGILLDLTNSMEGRSSTRQLPETTKTKPFTLTAPKSRTIPIPKIVRITSHLYSLF
jgi:hypothetical protein